MNLEQTIIAALDYTRRLQAALKLGNLEMCSEILQLRGEAMQHFEAAHRAAPPAEQERHAGLVAQLAEADRQLQEDTRVQLGSVAEEFRANLNSGPARSNRSYQTGPTQACVDFKA